MTIELEDMRVKHGETQTPLRRELSYDQSVVAMQVKRLLKGLKTDQERMHLLQSLADDIGMKYA